MRKKTKEVKNDWIRGYDVGYRDGLQEGYKKAIKTLLEFIGEVCP